MPYSDPVNKPYTLELIREVSPRTVLDVGTGAGVYADMLRAEYGDGVHITGIEPWQPYYERFNLLAKYDAMSLRDVRFVSNFRYDLVLFGDVLEHMSRGWAIETWERALSQGGRAILSIPIIHYPQGEEEGNPFERHVEENWTKDEVLDSFVRITEWRAFDVTMVAIAS